MHLIIAVTKPCGRLPDTGADLCSQPTVSRWENAPSLRDLIRLMRVMVLYQPGE
jgi:hypothetical protein